MSACADSDAVAIGEPIHHTYAARNRLIDRQ